MDGFVVNFGKVARLMIFFNTCFSLLKFLDCPLQRYNVLNYDDKVVDGFYDVYGVALDFSSGTMPALIDLQETAVLDKISWEVVLVNRATDNNLVNLEQKAISIALKFRVGPGGLKRSGLANRIAVIVADQMGGPVNDEALLHKRWRANSAELRVSLGNVVLPLGRLQIGLGRHRALLFKLSNFSQNQFVIVADIHETSIPSPNSLLLHVICIKLTPETESRFVVYLLIFSFFQIAGSSRCCWHSLSIVERQAVHRK